MNTSNQNEKKIRYDLLDVGRFLAAFSVLMYHFVFKGWSLKEWYLDYPFGDFWKYGFLGVQFFFIISGFVVFMSARHKGLVNFIASRIARLFPAYWICIITTFIFVWFLTSEHQSFLVFFTNFSMLEGLIKVPYIDPVYWSLTYELIFYFWISCFLFFKCNEQELKLYLVFFLILSSISYFIKLPNVIILIFQSVYAPYFIAGICFYNLTEVKNYKDIVLLLWCYCLSLVQVNHQLVELSAINNVPVSSLISFSIISSIYILFFFMSFNILKIKLPWAAKIGALTYPLYLIHMEIGSGLFGKYGNQNNKYIILISSIACFLIFSYLVNKFIERPLAPKLKNYSKSFISRFYKRGENI